MKSKADEDRLIAELLATFPGLCARPLSDFGAPGWERGVWTGGDAVMPDGLPIFGSLAINDSDYYNGTVHHAFEAWLQDRGWYIENYDGATHFIVPNPDDLGTDEA